MFAVIGNIAGERKMAVLRVCTRLWVSLGLLWVTVGVGAGDCGRSRVLTRLLLQTAF